MALAFRARESMSCIRPVVRHLLRSSSSCCIWRATSTSPCSIWHARRYLQTSVESEPADEHKEVRKPNRRPRIGFAFDVDGVLIRGKKRLRGARAALLHLKHNAIPFILLTNGGGMGEKNKADFLGTKLRVPIPINFLIQSHTPFRDMDEYKDKTVLVVGGVKDYCRHAAHRYGFKKVLLPSDIWKMYNGVWPFASAFHNYHETLSQSAKPLPPHIDPKNSTNSIKIDAIFVYNDPRDWGLDATLIIDCLLSKDGVLGTLSPKNGNPDLPNKGYQQDGQPPLFFSNPDLWWSGDYPLPRLGQGGFRAAVEGIWQAVTGGGVELEKTIIGKPHQLTYRFAEKELNNNNQHLTKGLEGPDAALGPLEKVYMLGDNPESDIRGANDFKSPSGTKWKSILLRTGVYSGGEPSVKPTVIQDDVYAGVRWALQDAGFDSLPPEQPDEEIEGFPEEEFVQWGEKPNSLKAETNGGRGYKPQLYTRTLHFGKKSEEGGSATSAKPQPGSE